MKKNRTRQATGFSLIEVLVALTIMAVSLGLILEIFSGGLRQINRGEQNFRAMLQAESLMNDLGANLPLHKGIQQGKTDQGYEWKIEIKPYEPEMGEVDVAAPLGELYDISVRVSWQSGLRTRDVTLNSLRYISGEQ